MRFLILHLSKLVSINDQNPNQDIFQAVFDDIRSKKTLFLRNMISRSKQISDGSHLWKMSDEDLKKFAIAEVEKIGILRATDVTDAHVVRVPGRTDYLSEILATKPAVKE